MTNNIIDGTKVAANLRAKVADGVRQFQESTGRVPGLDVILVGEDPASQVYTRNKEKAALEVGMRSRLHRLPAETTEAQVLALLDELNRDNAVDGILVQLPLPKHIKDESVIDRIDPAKDVDGFHRDNAGALFLGRPRLVPCTPRGCMHLIAHAGVDVAGKHAVVVGRSNIVGKPVAQLLLMANATVTIAHSRTPDLPATCRTADILVAAVGKPQMIKGDWIKKGATVIDVGINRIPTDDGKGRLVGDVDFESASPVAGAITPVPRGVGPMTIACLLENTLIAARARTT